MTSFRLLSAFVPAFALLHSTAHKGRCTDADSDGIPAEWEEFRGTSDADPADALIDFDGDGLNTYMEFITQGRPWGNYELVRFPWDLLPASISLASLSAGEFIAANRSGEYLVNCTDAAGDHTILWTPVPGSPLADDEITEVSVVLQRGVMWNDLGQVFLPGGAAGSGDIRNLREWSEEAIPVEWTATEGQAPIALSNDGRILLSWPEWDWFTSASGSFSWGIFHNYQWTDGTVPGEILTLGHDPFATNLTTNHALDPASGAWLLGAFSSIPYGGHTPESLGWRLGTDAAAESLLATANLPSGTYGGGVTAASAGGAVGIAYGNSDNAPVGIMFDGTDWQAISGGIAGSGPVLFGVSDTGIVLGWNVSGPPYTPFLWSGIAVELGKARREVAGGIQPVGLTGSGAIYAMDYGDNTSVPEPVVFRPLPHAVGDGAAEETAGVLSDSDADGIPDAQEAAVGTSAALADTDGDGWADLFEMVFERNANSSEPVPAAAAATGLVVHSPRRHPLQRTTAGIP